jgi:predicted oxidoreductase
MRLGSWGAQLNTDALDRFVQSCLDLDLRIMDHADIYGDHSTEADFGRVLSGRSSLREQLVLISKCGVVLPGPGVKRYDLSPFHILRSVEGSLRALQTDYLDVLLLHRPDYLMRIDDIALCLESLLHDGKVCYVGLSNFSVMQTELILSVCPNMVLHQFELSPLSVGAVQDGLLEQCQLKGLRPMAWSPLAGGRLFEHPQLALVLQELAAAYRCAPASLVYAWLLRHPSRMIPVTGTANPDRLRDAAAAREINLSHEDWYRIWSAVQGELA